MLDLDNIIRDVLYYAHPDSGVKLERARGVIIGVVTTLMAERNIQFRPAMEIVVHNLKPGFLWEAIPGAWLSCLVPDTGLLNGEEVLKRDLHRAIATSYRKGTHIGRATAAIMLLDYCKSRTIHPTPSVTDAEYYINEVVLR